MVGCKVLEKHRIVVMDATDRNNLYSIASWMLNIANGDIRLGAIYPLSERCKSIEVIEFETTDRGFKIMQFVIEDLYPGLCVFDPPM